MEKERFREDEEIDIGKRSLITYHTRVRSAFVLYRVAGTREGKRQHTCKKNQEK